MSQQDAYNATHIDRPNYGQTVVIPINADNMRFSMEFTPEPNAVQKNGDDLEFSFEGGGKIVLQGYYDHFSDKTLPIMITENGEEMSGEDFLAALDEDLLTEAGPGAGPAPSAPGGGASEYADDPGSLADGIDRLGSLGTIYWDRATEVPEIYLSDETNLNMADKPVAISDLDLGGGELEVYEELLDNAFEGAIHGGSKADGKESWSVVQNFTYYPGDVAPGQGDVLPNLSINGQSINGFPIIIEGGYGSLRITGYSGPDASDLYTVNYQYLLTENVNHSGGDVLDNFTVLVKDMYGETQSAALSVAMEDDRPYIEIVSGAENEITDPLFGSQDDDVVSLRDSVRVANGELNIITSADGPASAESLTATLPDGSVMDLSGLANGASTSPATFTVNDIYVEYFFSKDASGKLSYGFEMAGDNQTHEELAWSFQVTFAFTDGDGNKVQDILNVNMADKPVVISDLYLGTEKRGGYDVTGGDDGSDLIYGGGGDDVIFGQGGNEEIHSGIGSDIIFGGQGADILAWRPDDYDNVIDKIMDFNLDNGDKLRFEGLLEDTDTDITSMLDGTRLTVDVNNDNLTLNILKDGMEQVVEVNFNGGLEVGGTVFDDYASFANTYNSHGSNEQQIMLNELLIKMVTE